MRELPGGGSNEDPDDWLAGRRLAYVGDEKNGRPTRNRHRLDRWSALLTHPGLAGQGNRGHAFGALGRPLMCGLPRQGPAPTGRTAWIEHAANRAMLPGREQVMITFAGDCHCLIYGQGQDDT